MKRRLIGLVLSGMLHAAVILAVVALVRFTAEPILFVDLAHGLDLAEEAVSDLRHAVADVRSPRLGARRSRLSKQARPGAFGPIVTGRGRAGAASRGRAARPSGIAAARADPRGARAGPRGARAPAFRRATARR